MATKIKFLTDEDFRRPIVDGIRIQLPELDIVRVQEVGLRSFQDHLILEFAASENRIVLSQDVRTMKVHASARLSDDLPMPGLFLVPDTVPIGRVLQEIVTIVECSRDNEWNGMIRYLPL